MKLFKNLLQFLSKEQLEKLEEYRRSERYKIAPEISVESYILRNDKKYKVKIIDISLHGIGCEEDDPLEMTVDEMAEVILIVDGIEIPLMSRLAYRDEKRLGFDVFSEVQKSYNGYLQLLTLISVGATLKEEDQKNIEQTDKGYIKHIYSGVQDSSLTLWTTKGNLKKTDDIQMFEFNMDDFIMRIEDHQFTYTFLDESRIANVDEEEEDVSAILEKESKKLFKLIILSTKENMSANLKEYLLQVIS